MPAPAAGSVAVVTGAANGIGRALARRFAEQQLRLVLVDVDEPALDEAVAELTGAGAEVLKAVVDVGDDDRMQGLARTVVSHFGQVDMVCNNAGVVVTGPIWSVPLEQWRRIVDVNVLGVVHGIRAFVPLLVAQGHGHVMNTASMAGVTSGAGLGPYAASKHAVVAISEALHKELAVQQSAVRVSVLCPGAVLTSMPERSVASAATGDDVRVSESVGAAVQAVVRGAITPDVVADKVWRALAADRFWIFTHPERLASVRERVDDMVLGRDPGPGYG